MKLPFVTRAKYEAEQIKVFCWEKEYAKLVDQNLGLIGELYILRLEINKHNQRRDAKGKFCRKEIRGC